ncbi:MAG: hypothetical protein HYV61_09580 [Candidatus Rokubacteria bacterium]|nr:hypothetical protein [Candidatus Rokubacteria bacterium]
MELMPILEAYAALEKQGVELYQTLGERFPDAQGSRLWAEMANTEASHQAILMLAMDWTHTWSGPKSEPPIEMGDLDAAIQTSGDLLAEAARPDLSFVRAVELAVAWEEQELPRILAIAPYCPGRGQGQLLAMVAEAVGHYDELAALARAAGQETLIPRIEALRTTAEATVR